VKGLERSDLVRLQERKVHLPFLSKKCIFEFSIMSSAVPDDMGPWVKQQLAAMGQSDAPDMLVSASNYPTPTLCLGSMALLSVSIHVYSCGKMCTANSCNSK